MNIKDLSVEIENKTILKHLSLNLEKGKTHAIMGPNGSGKSTLSKTISGHPDCDVKSGSITYKGRELLEMDPDERAREGIFMSFQSPVEIPGVNNAYFLRMALNKKREHQGLEPLNPAQFLKAMKIQLEMLGMDPSMIQRSLNAGFSGGEKKRNEILQMSILEPEFIILDEIDSGLDIDALKAVAEGINRIKNEERTLLVITHYRRILDYIHPDYIHVLRHGEIVRTGGLELVDALEEEGYAILDTV